MASNDKSDDDVGYGKPPKATRFKVGQSGNPRGRPKGARNLATDLSNELAQKIVIREGDVSRSVSKQRALVKTLVSKALKGEARFAGLLVGLILRQAEQPNETADTSAPLADDDRQIIDDFLRRHSQNSR